jgi:DNA-binding NtrC family response regulator
MKALRIILMDFGTEHLLAQQVSQIFADSKDPPFDIDSSFQNEKQTPSTVKWLVAHADGCSAALTIFAFDRCPSDSEVAPLLETAHRAGHGQPSIVVVQAESAQQVAHILCLGATDVWIPPLRAAEALGRAIHWAGIVPLQENEVAVERLKAELGLKQFVGESPALMAELRKIPAIASSDMGVLIRGETGTGKEICARAVHYLSPRASRPFIPVNAGALPPELVENELFGHESGAFTSANSCTSGLIQQADGGTLFLDEIDSLPLPAQVKLLRFLQDKQYRPLGSRKGHAANVRVIAASNADLQAAIRAGRFRRDLYYRLSAVELLLPPLRERGRDIELLARHCLQRYSAEMSKSIAGLTKPAVLKLMSYDWPGNVRELENVIAHAVLFARHELIRPEDLTLPQPETPQGTSFKALKAHTIRTFEVNYLTAMMQAHDGNLSNAAHAAGMHRSAFWRLLRKQDVAASQSNRQRL